MPFSRFCCRNGRHFIVKLNLGLSDIVSRRHPTDDGGGNGIFIFAEAMPIAIFGR